MISVSVMMYVVHSNCNSTIVRGNSESACIIKYAIVLTALFFVNLSVIWTLILPTIKGKYFDIYVIITPEKIFRTFMHGFIPGSSRTSIGLREDHNTAHSSISTGS